MNQATPYRSPWMTTEHDDFRRTVRRFFEEEISPFREKWEEQQHVDLSVWKKAGDLGLLCISVPEEYGGLGGSFAHEAIVIEEQVRAGDSAFGIVGSSIMGTPFLLEAASEEQCKRWIPQLAEGRSVLAFALTEPGAGSDAKAIRTTAKRDGDSYLINGSKTFITNGYNADLTLVVAKTSPEAGTKEAFSVFMVENRNAPGYSIGNNLKKIGQKGQDTVELFFDNLRVPAENLLGHVEGRGFGQIMTGFRTERIATALVAVSRMERATELTVEYTKNRRAFGQALFDMQNTRMKLAECATKSRIGRLFIDDCIMKVIAGNLETDIASMAKWWCTEMEGQVVDECLQLHGGYGYITEYPIARMYSDARIQRIYGGATEIQKEIIARAL